MGIVFNSPCNNDLPGNSIGSKTEEATALTIEVGTGDQSIHEAAPGSLEKCDGVVAKQCCSSQRIEIEKDLFSTAPAV